MTVEKTFGFGNSSPYRSATFNKNNELVFDRNGAMAIGSITNDGPDVILEGITFIQKGVIVKKIGTDSVTFPVGLPSPFYLSATVPDTSPTDNVSFSFVRRPQDIGENLALIAEWDGSEWRSLERLTIKELVEHRLEEALAYDNVGFNQGFKFQPNPLFTEYTLTAGQVTDKTGSLVTKYEDTVFDALTADPDYNRIDFLLWRRPTDFKNRIGYPILRAGPTEDGSTITQSSKITSGDVLAVDALPQIINLPDNTYLLFYVEHYGDNGILTVRKYDVDRVTALTVAKTVMANVQNYSVSLDTNERVMVIAEQDGNIFRAQVDNIGDLTLSPAVIESLTNPSSKPKIITDFAGIHHVVFLYQIGATSKIPYFLNLSLGGTVTQAATVLINSTNNYENFDIDMNEDFEIHGVFQDATNGVIEYEVYDDSGVSVADRKIISSDTTYGLLTLNSTARNPHIKIAENLDIFITFEQSKGSEFGLVLYSEKYYLDIFTTAAVMFNLDTPTENIDNHLFILDWTNHAHFLVNTEGRLVYNKVYMPTTNLAINSVFEVNALACSTFDLVYDKYGSLILSYSEDVSGSTNNGAPIGDLIFGQGTFGTESVFISDTEMAVQTGLLSALTPVPTVGDSFTIAGSLQGNDGTYIVLETRDSVIDGVPYRILKINAGIFAIETGSGPTAQFTSQNPNDLYISKQTASLSYTYSDIVAKELDSDLIAVGVNTEDNDFISWDQPIFINAGNFGLIKDDAFLTSSGQISWDVALAGGTLEWTSDLLIQEPYRHNFRIPAGNVAGLAEQEFIYIKIPQDNTFIKDGDTDALNTVTVDDSTQYSIGQKVFIGDADSVGLEATVVSVGTGLIELDISTVDFTVVRGAYIISVDVTLLKDIQNEGLLRPNSNGEAFANLYIIAHRRDNLVHFRDGGLTLEDGESGNIGDGVGQPTLDFIGANNQADATPDYNEGGAHTDADSTGAIASQSDYNSVADENLKSRVAKLTAMMADKAQDKTLMFAPSFETVSNFNSGSNQSVSFSGGSLEIIQVSTAFSTLISLSSSGVLAENEALWFRIDRNAAVTIATLTLLQTSAISAVPLEENVFIFAYRLSTQDIYLWNNFRVGTGETLSPVPTSIIRQNLNLKLIEGGTWSLVGNVLSHSAPAYIQVPGLANNVNEIQAGDVTVSNGFVAYIDIARSGGAGIKYFGTASVNGYVGNDNRVVIARGTSTGMIVGTGSFSLIPGQSKELDAGLSLENRTFIGITDESDFEPSYSLAGSPQRTIADTVPIVASMSSMDSELNKWFGQLRITPHETDLFKVRISSVDFIMKDGTTLSQELQNLVLDFEGAVIDFNAKDVFKSDGFTSLGLAFPALSIPVSEYSWVGIAIIPSDLGPDNRIQGQVLVTPSGSSDIASGGAIFPPIAGDKKSGAIELFNNAGSIEVFKIRQLGVGSGSGSGTGDANELLERLKNRQQDSIYQWLTPNIFSVDSKTLVNEPNTTAEFSIIDKAYKFENNVLNADILPISTLNFPTYQSGGVIENVHVSGDGTYMLVGTPGDSSVGSNHGSISVYKNDGNGDYSNLVNTLTASNPAIDRRFGYNVYSTPDASVIACGNVSGVVIYMYIFEKTGVDTWTETTRITYSFTTSGPAKPRISANGLTITDNFSRIYRKVGPTWTEIVAGLGGIITTSDGLRIISPNHGGAGTVDIITETAPNVWTTTTSAQYATVIGGPSHSVLSADDKYLYLSFPTAFFFPSTMYVLEDDGSGNWPLAYSFNLPAIPGYWGKVFSINPDGDLIALVNSSGPAPHNLYTINRNGNTWSVASDYGLYNQYNDSVVLPYPVLAGDNLFAVNFTDADVFVFDNPQAGEIPASLETIQLLDSDYLLGKNHITDPTELSDITKIEFLHFWDLDAFDTGAIYEATRNGGVDWQVMTTERIGNSDTIIATHVFEEEATNSFAQTIGAAVTGVVDLTDLVEPERIFTLAETTVLKTVKINVTVTGSPKGVLYAELSEDDGGSIGTILSSSSYVNLDGLSTGIVEFVFTVPLEADNFHIHFKTDDEYKGEYTLSAGANKISLDIDAGGDVVYDIEGRILDLRVRITNSIDQVVSKGMGVFFIPEIGTARVQGEIDSHTVRFTGDIDNLSTFPLPFIADGNLLMVFEKETGQVYRRGAGSFSLDGANVNFPPGTFNKPGIVTLEFIQLFGNSFDNSDANRALIAANYLWSANSAIDQSLPGRGFTLRRPDGTPREITINDSDQVVIKSVP